MTEHNHIQPEHLPDLSRLADELSNSDIQWDGTLYGLVPTIVGKAALQLLTLGEVSISQLVDVLDDESRFVAAHVLLTMLSNVQYHTAPWNGLAIELSANNEVRIDSAQRFELAQRWRAWQAVTPRPHSLFPE